MCELKLMQLFICQLLSIDLSLDYQTLVVFLILLDLFLYLFEEIGEDNPITSRGGNLFLKIMNPGHFLIKFLQNLFNIILYFMCLLKVLFLLYLVDMLLILLYLLHLGLQDGNKFFEDFLCDSWVTFFSSSLMMLFMHSFKSARILSTFLMISLLMGLKLYLRIKFLTVWNF